MASIQKHGNRYRAQVFVKGERASALFDTRKEAALWALEREAEMRGKKLPDKTFGDAMLRYSHDISEDRAGGHWERVRLRAMMRMPIAKRRMEALDGSDFAVWRDARLSDGKAPGTVAREMTLMRGVLEVARRDWRWLRSNPMNDVRWPKTPKGRARRITPDEEATLIEAFGLTNSLKSETATQRVGLAFLFALETAMRSGEIVSMTRQHIFLDAQYVHLPKTKNGESRDVPLSRRACEILRALPLGFGPVFQLDAATRDTLWRRVRDTTPHGDIHFHDSRAEAIWRLSKKLDVMQLARVIGHRDLNSLLIYYAESAESMAKQLG